MLLFRNSHQDAVLSPFFSFCRMERTLSRAAYTVLSGCVLDPAEDSILSMPSTGSTKISTTFEVQAGAIASHTTNRKKILIVLVLKIKSTPPPSGWVVLGRKKFVHLGPRVACVVNFDWLIYQLNTSKWQPRCLCSDSFALHHCDLASTLCGWVHYGPSLQRNRLR